MNYTWLTDILIAWGEQAPEYFDATLGRDLRTCALMFWAVFLWAIMHPVKER